MGASHCTLATVHDAPQLLFCPGTREGLKETSIGMQVMGHIDKAIQGSAENAEAPEDTDHGEQADDAAQVDADDDFDVETVNAADGGDDAMQASGDDAEIAEAGGKNKGDKRGSVGAHAGGACSGACSTGRG
jgi:hypothetical protein